jgi:hypothetical protein
MIQFYGPQEVPLTLADMYLWVRLKQLNYANALPNHEDTLKQRILQAVEAIFLKEAEEL